MTKQSRISTAARDNLRNAVARVIDSRFSGMGTGGRHSSGFQNTATAAGSNFAQDLQAQRMGLQRQATMDLAQMAGMLMGQRPYEQYLVPKNKEQGFFGNLAGGLGQGLGAGIGGLLGGLF